MRYSIPRKSRRVPLVTEVHLKLEEVPDPVTAVTSNVSLGGMSVAVERMAEVGSLVAFELEVGGALVEGTGEVAWVRGESSTPGMETGMGIRYRYLSPGSRERIFRLVQWYSSQGSSASAEEVQAAASGLTPPPGGVKTPAPPRPAPTAAAPPVIAPAEAPEPPVVPPPRASAPPSASRQEIDPESTAPFLQRPAAGPSEQDPWTYSDDDTAGTLDLPGPAAVPAQPAVIIDEDDDIPPMPAELGEGRSGGRDWVSAAEVRGTRAEPLVLPDGPGEPVLSPAEVAQLPFARMLPPPKARGAGYAKRSGWSWWIWLAVLLLVGLGIFAALSWWQVYQRMSSAPPAAGARTVAASGTTSPRPLPGAPVGVPRREDAEAPRLTPAEASELPVAETPPPPIQPAPAAAPPDTASAESEPADSATGEGETQASQAADSQPDATEAAVPAAPAPIGQPATEVRAIRWEAGSGTTVVVIQTNGEVSRVNLLSSPIGGSSPRVLIRIRGIGRQYPDTPLAVGTPEVATIRTGLHVTNLGPELHVVLVLGGSRVELKSLETVGGTIRATLGRAA